MSAIAENSAPAAKASAAERKQEEERKKMTYVQLASATLDATKARAVALESPLSDEDAAILGSMDFRYFNGNVPDAVANTWMELDECGKTEKISWRILCSIAAEQRNASGHVHNILRNDEVTEEQFSSTMELVSSMPKETIDEMLMMAKYIRPGEQELMFVDKYGGVEGLANFRAEVQAKKDQRIAMLKGLMAAGDINATARACWKILLDQIQKTCDFDDTSHNIYNKPEMEVFYDAIAQIDLEGKPEWANVDFSTLIPDLGKGCSDWGPVTAYTGRDAREMKFVDPATGKVCGLRFTKTSQGVGYGDSCKTTNLELVHPGGEKEVVVSNLGYMD